MYRNELLQINKVVHPLNEEDKWEEQAAIENKLLQCFRSVHKIAMQLGIETTVEKANKILTQIPCIATGVQQWINQANQQLNQWVANQVMSKVEKDWLMLCALPYCYWQIQLSKTQAKRAQQEVEK